MANDILIFMYMMSLLCGGMVVAAAIVYVLCPECREAMKEDLFGR